LESLVDNQSKQLADFGWKMQAGINNAVPCTCCMSSWSEVNLSMGVPGAILDSAIAMQSTSSVVQEEFVWIYFK
jgi:hypothetical protein